jgi:hypothetical protein
VKLSSAGKVMWTKSFGGAGTDMLRGSRSVGARATELPRTADRARCCMMENECLAAADPDVVIIHLAGPSITAYNAG